MLKTASIFCWTVLVLLVGFFAAGYFAINFLHIPQQPGLIYAMFWAHWLITVAACVLAVRWSFSCPQRRFYISLILALLAMASSYWGLTCIRISSTTEVNGRVQYRFDSRWFFTASVVLATLAFAFVLWKRWRLRYVA